MSSKPNKSSKINQTSKASTILVFAGLDPTGGAGIQADIETLSSLQIHALPVVTCLTVQNTHNVVQIQSVDTLVIQQQIATLLKDIQPKAIKLGLLSSVAIINIVSATLKDSLKSRPDLAIIFDPVLHAGGGTKLTADNAPTEKIIATMREKIIPYSTIITPNSLEARLLTGKQTLADCAASLLELGCKHVLISGEHENNPDEIINTLYSTGNSEPQVLRWTRLPHQYHGSGCTLASALAAYLAKNESIQNASKKAQAYTDSTLRHAVKLGQGQYHPNRLGKHIND